MGHDDKEDIKIKAGPDTHPIQIKSGQVGNEYLVLSGHRLGRFKGDLQEISSYLRGKSANIISVPYEKKDAEQGRIHIYQVSYVDLKYLTDVRVDNWGSLGKRYEQVNSHGVRFSLRPTMSWQIWWSIPLSLVTQERSFEIG